MDEIGGYKIHPAADCFPMMEGQEWKALVKSIGTQGLLEPVVVDEDDLILDGRNRAQACVELDIDIETEEFGGEDPIAFVIAKNLIRRHLTVGQLAIASDKLANLPPGRPSKTSPAGGVSQTEAAGLMKVSPRSQQRVKALREGGREDLYEEVGKGTMTPAAANRKMRKDVAVARIRSEPAPLPDGPFRVIMADPAWQYDKRVEDPSSRGKADDQYPTMTFEQIADLPIESLVHEEGSILWLWTTNAHIFQAGELCELWGFVPKTVLTWDKGSIGTGDWLRGQTEHCVMAVKGKAVVNLTNQSTIIRAPRREHSRKPEEFYQLVESLCPGSKVELFARERREGITPWGAESDLFDA